MKRFYILGLFLILTGLSARAATFQNSFTTNAVPENVAHAWQNTNSFPGTIISYPTNWGVVQNDHLTSTNFQNVYAVTNGSFGFMRRFDEIFIPTNNAGAGINQQCLIAFIIDNNHALLWPNPQFNLTNVTFQYYPSSYAGTDIQGTTNNRWSGAITSEQTFCSLDGPDTYQGSFGGGLWLVDVGNFVTDCLIRTHILPQNGSPWNGDRLVDTVNYWISSQPILWFEDVNAPGLRNGVLADATVMVGGLTNYTTGNLKSGSVLQSPGIATTSVLSGNITATGFTNTLGTNVYGINAIGAVSITVKNNAGTTVATLTGTVGGTVIPLQPGGSVTAASGLSGTYWGQ